MGRWLLRLWHRFTLGRTAAEFPMGAFNSHHSGSVGDIAYRVRGAANAAKPVGVRVIVCVRAATDLPSRTFRIVIEGN